MTIPIHTSVRGVTLAATIIAIFSIFIVSDNSKKKNEYPKIVGKIEYFDKQFLHLPTRHKGDYRYLIIDTYPYPFEVYEPNSEPTEKTIDDLEIGDEIAVYYYERNNTHELKLNRFLQFIDKEGETYFARNAFQQNLGYILIGMCLLLVLGAIGLWKFGKLKW